MDITPLEQLYQNVWWSVFWTGLGISLFAGLILTFLATAVGRAIGFILGMILTFGGVVAAPVYAGNQGDYSTTTAFEKAKDEKATYVEKLLGDWVGYNVVTHTCQYRDNEFDTNDTGCEYVTRNSYCDSRDEDGDCTDWDYEFTPWFKFEESLTAELNTFRNGHVIFASHLAPENWQQNLYRGGIGGFGSSLPMNAQFEYRRDPEWLRVKEAIDNNVVLPGAVYHLYFNWVHADDLELNDANRHNIPKYQQAGLLPRITRVVDSKGREVQIDIHGNRRGSGFDHHLVQFLNMNVSKEVDAQFQSVAADWSGMAGPEIEASLMLVFAPASQIPNPDEWILTSKAWLRDEVQHGRYILPKNLVLVMCGVSDDNSTVLWCRLETGMHKGNEELIADVVRMKPIPFTPESIFGRGTSRFASNADGSLIMVDPDEGGPLPARREVIKSFEGGTLDAFLRAAPPNGFDRVEMATQEYRRLTLKPDPEQIQAIIDNAWNNALKGFGSAWFMIYATIIGGYLKSRSS